MIRRLRLFLIVFVAVWVTGIGFTGASALWSQRADVTSTVTTGNWQEPQWSWTPRITVPTVNRNGSMTEFTLAWSAPQRPTSGYVVTVVGGTVVMDAGARTARVTVPNGHDSFQVRLYAVAADGQRSLPVTRTASVHPGGGGTVTLS